MRVKEKKVEDFYSLSVKKISRQIVIKFKLKQNKRFRLRERKGERWYIIIYAKTSKKNLQPDLDYYTSETDLQVN